MRITIAERLRPYSHTPGVWVPLPRSSLEVQVFPAFIRIRDLSEAYPRDLGEVSVAILGPVDQFTVVLDLERGLIRVWGKSLGGFFRYRLSAVSSARSISIVIEKSPSEGLHFSESSLIFLIKESSDIELQEKERLSLGNHKAQDWDAVCRRLNPIEFFPVWYRLGRLVPEVSFQPDLGMSLLLKKCEHAIQAGAPEHILSHFRTLFRVAFTGIMSPRLTDEYHHGIPIPKPDSSVKNSPLFLLKKGSELIRRLFLDVSGNNVHFLPAIPPEFHCGRFLQVTCGSLGEVDIEWTKKNMRQLIFRAASDETLIFHFPYGIKKFRLRHGDKDRGEYLSCGGELKVCQGNHYFFDNFQS